MRFHLNIIKNPLSKRKMFFQRLLISKRCCIHYNSFIKHQQNFQRQSNANYKSLNKRFSGRIIYEWFKLSLS